MSGIRRLNEQEIMLFPKGLVSINEAVKRNPPGMKFSHSLITKHGGKHVGQGLYTGAHHSNLNKALKKHGYHKWGHNIWQGHNHFVSHDGKHVSVDHKRSAPYEYLPKSSW